MERIQKILATAGVASRRAIEQMIAEGRITVNARPASLGQKIGPKDYVRVDGKHVPLSFKAVATQVLLYRKRVGEMVTRDDPEGRRTVFRKLPELEGARWIAIGRLDINTSGLLLLTTDGELARRLTHPSFEITREYAARVLGDINEDTLDRMRTGVKLDDGMARFAVIESMSASPEDDGAEEGTSANRWFRVVVREGRNRLVRRVFESQDLQVSRLIRVAYGPIKLGRGIRTGSYREATGAEVKALLQSVKMGEASPARGKGRPARPGGKPARPGRPARRGPGEPRKRR